MENHHYKQQKKMWNEVAYRCCPQVQMKDCVILFQHSATAQTNHTQTIHNDKRPEYYFTKMPTLTHNIEHNNNG
jgi:hypothetical protein